MKRGKKTQKSFEKGEQEQTKKTKQGRIGIATSSIRTGGGVNSLWEDMAALGS
ncbi:hypothetical protein CCACVL1_31055 [Corchorus capsularis]|uniref:Uncharacterized protein n=1 Tax=Corchorus capsularis TaxID=210143 RepID=A0A1R3FU21_COCAP|nr:hypothetical protein CCACVL1_31055 [Corchorus capsularis]